MVEGYPVAWVKNKPGAYRMVSDQHGTRLEPSESMVVRVVGTVFFLVFAASAALFSVGIYSEAQSDEDSPLVTGCWGYQTEIILGGNPPYCYESYSDFIDLEVSEDQHVRETTQDPENGELYREEYRWEDVDDSVVYGFIFEGQYYCERFLPEFILEDDWVPEDFDDSFVYPDWCGTSVENQDTRVYEEGAHPYDDVWMYVATDIESMSYSLFAHKNTEDRFSERLYTAKSLVEQERTEWEAEGEVFGLWALCCTVPITLLFLFAADTRPRVFVVNRHANTITRRRSGRYPSFSRTWSDVNFKATTVVRSVRQKHHSTGGGPNETPAEHWTTDHPGLNIVIRYGQRQEVLLFFEDGGDVNVHGQVIRDFMAAMGVEFNVDGIPNPQAEMFARPTLQYIAESNGGVSDWNDGTANFIIGWYYESDPKFIEKYPQAEHDPEFMLEPGGNRPFKEMYRRPLYDGAGITSVRSTEDAQRLLDHVLALRFLESSTQETTLKKEPKTEVDTTVARRSFSVGLKEDVGAESSGPSSDSETPSFWSNLEDDDS